MNQHRLKPTVLQSAPIDRTQAIWSLRRVLFVLSVLRLFPYGPMNESRLYPFSWPTFIMYFSL